MARCIHRTEYQVIKKNGDGKNTFWFGFKGRLEVTTKSQSAIPLLKKVEILFPRHLTTAFLDAESLKNGKSYAFNSFFSDFLLNTILPSHFLGKI